MREANEMDEDAEEALWQLRRKVCSLSVYIHREIQQENLFFIS